MDLVVNGMKKAVTFFVSLFCFVSISLGIEITSDVRIGLSYGKNAVSEFTMYAPSGLFIGDIGVMKGTVTFEKGSSKKLKITASGASQTCRVDEEEGVTVEPVDEDEFISYNGKEYRGTFVIYRFSDSDITVVNVVDLEEYLYGVVPKELSTGHPMEALKAQAVAARTYACQTLNKYQKWNFDMTNSTADQAYSGKSAEHEDTNRAVDETAGEIITYDGKPITAYYFSTSAGMTENSENVWVNAYPYLVAVEDTYQSENLPYSTWSVRFTAEELEKILLGRSAKIGELLSVDILKKSPSNAVLELEFVGSKDTYKVTKETARLVFGTSEVRSQFYDITTDNTVTVMNEEEETNTAQLSSLAIATAEGVISPKESEIYVKGWKEDKEYPLQASEYILNGKGWGHGVGMSQNGALGMAREGFTYDEILRWYYTDVEIEEVDKV